VPLGGAGHGTPFFCVHGIGGSAASFVPLVTAVGVDRPVYALQATGEEHASLADLAARYVEAVREVQPAGPYLLGGWSFGGVVAHEMARQFERAGQRVERLVMIDVPALLGGGPLSRLAVLTSTGRTMRAAFGRDRFSSPLRRAAHALEAADQFNDVAGRHLALWASHVPGDVLAPVVEFHALRHWWQELVFGSSHTERGLRRAASLSTHEIGADHYSILADPLLAVELGAALRTPVGMPGNGSSDEAELVELATQLVSLSPNGLSGEELLEALWVPDGEAHMFDSSDRSARGLDAIRATYAEGSEALELTSARLYEAIVRIAPGGQAAWVAGLIDSKVTLRHTGREVTFERVRATFTFERLTEQWRISHVHYSLPVGAPLGTMP
jgi:thioesterase domain-containing protein